MKFNSNPVEEHKEVPLADEGRWEELVEEWQKREGSNTTASGLHHSYVVSVARTKEPFPLARQEELLGLVRAQGDSIAGNEVFRLLRPDARALFRSGGAQEIAQRASKCGADLLIIDADLSPSQTRNLEDSTGFPVRDREAVILNVFQRHVKTRKARIQVEIAHLEYLRPRIRGLGLTMDQQAGGVVGSRGAGETASELLARQLDGRLAILRKSFAKITKEGLERRKRREGCRKIALIGYTNAGKTSLMNGLTEAGLSAADKPFETLDTTSRSLSRHGGDVLLSDTVGFIRDLPERLVASFESTLAEIHESELLAMVVDVSDEEASLHLETTKAMLEKLHAENIPRYYVFTKVDRLKEAPSPARLEELSHGFPYQCVNSHQTVDLALLREALLQEVRTSQLRAEVFVPYSATRAIELVYAKTRVLETESLETGMRFLLEADKHWIEAIGNNCGDRDVDSE